MITIYSYDWYKRLTSGNYFASEEKIQELTKVIYLASPYSHKSKEKMEKRYEAINKVAGKLQDKYTYAFILPITMSHNTSHYMKNNDTGFDAWRVRDLTYISVSNELWVVQLDSEWAKSKGVKEEIEYATKLGLPIKYLDRYGNFIGD